MFRRFVSIESRGLKTVPRRRADGDDEGVPEIHGTAAVFFDEGDRSGTQYELWPGHVERILPTAFDDIANDDVRALQNHRSDLLLGRSVAGTLTLDVKSHGLDYRIDTADTTAGRDTVTSLKRGDMTGSSFQFLPRSDGYEWTEEEHDGVTIYVRNLTSLQTYDVGPVTYPAYRGTSSGARSAMLCLSDCRSAHAQSELTSLREEVEAFIQENNYRSEAVAKLDALDDLLRLQRLENVGG